MLAHVPAQPLGRVLGHRETLSKALSPVDVYHRMVNGLLTGESVRLGGSPRLHGICARFH
jgi:hypothetical protein